MAEPTVVCPNCKTEIKLTESLAAPLLEATRFDFEKRLKQKDTDLAAKLKEESTKIAAEESRKAKLALSGELDQKTRALAELEKTLTENNAKLAEAQKAQADLLRKQRELDTKLREADLSVEKMTRDLHARTQRRLLAKIPRVDHAKVTRYKRKGRARSLPK